MRYRGLPREVAGETLLYAAQCLMLGLGDVVPLPFRRHLGFVGAQPCGPEDARYASSVIQTLGDGVGLLVTDYDVRHVHWQ